MEYDMNLEEIDAEIRHLKAAARKLNAMGDNFPALSRNTARILASIRMLELNVSEIVALETATSK
jgi:hypothetical protein